MTAMNPVVTMLAVADIILPPVFKAVCQTRTVILSNHQNLNMHLNRILKVTGASNTNDTTKLCSALVAAAGNGQSWQDQQCQRV